MAENETFKVELKKKSKVSFIKERNTLFNNNKQF